VSKHDVYQRKLALFVANALKYYRQYLKGLLHSGLAKDQTLGARDGDVRRPITADTLSLFAVQYPAQGPLNALSRVSGTRASIEQFRSSETKLPADSLLLCGVACLNLAMPII